MKISTEVYLEAKSILAGGGIDKAPFEAGLIFKHITGKNRLETDFVADESNKEIIKLCRKRAQRYPLQYLLGSWQFLGREFKVGEGVLIPRQESEEVCLEAIGTIKDKIKPVVFDLCSGSGIFACSIQNIRPDASVTAVEKSREAFEYLKANAGNVVCEMENNPRLVMADIFEYHKELDDECADLIISNPPYVSDEEYEKLDAELFYEPKIALVPPAGENGLMFYSFIAENYHSKLKNGAALVFEIGSGQGAEVLNILKFLSYKNIVVKKDLSGLDRIVTAFK